MIDILQGSVQQIHEKSCTFMVQGVGFRVYSPHIAKLSLNTPTSLFTYLHWNPEQGPALYGFTSQLDREVFLLIIECPKIGPSIALSLLSQMSALQFLQAVSSLNDKVLSAVNGIGPKKAEQLIAFLKHKTTKMLASGQLADDGQPDTRHLNELSEVLTSLNYSKQEMAKALAHVAEKYGAATPPLDQLIRSALGFLSKGS